MARTTINSQGVPVGTITASDLSYPLTDFSSTGIDDNASSNAITISSSQAVTMSGLTYPTTDGTANQVLTTDGSGGLSFADTSSGGVEYVAKTTTYTASANEGIIADTSGGAWTLTLPASPSTGDKVFVADGDDWSTNNLTVARNGSTIEGSAADFVMDYGGVNVGFIYDGSTWQVYPQAGLLQLIGIDDNATSTALTIDSSGNVGIGGAPSTGDLHIQRTGEATSITLTTDNDQVNQINFGDGDNNFSGYIRYDNNNDAMSFRTNASERMRIDSSGRVGIATDAPTSTLDVEGRFTISGGSALANSVHPYMRRDGGNLRIAGRSDGGSGGNIMICTGANEDARVTVDPSGNVGIGKTPVATLDVANGTTYTASGDWLARIQQNTNATGKNGLSVMNAWAATASTIFECAMGWDGSTVGYYPVFTIDGLGQAIFSPQRAEAMRIDSNGNVGIGTNNPSRTLSVKGPSGAPEVLEVIAQTTTPVNNAVFRVASDIGGTNTTRFRVELDGDVKNINNSYGALSDISMKSNIVDANSQLADIMSIRVRKYTLNESGETHIGVIAQELEESGLSGLVDDTEEGLKAVKYSILYMKAIKALQEQQVMIDSQSSTIADLTTRLEALEAN